MKPTELPPIDLYRGDDETRSLLFQISETEPYDLRVWSEIRMYIRDGKSYNDNAIAKLSTVDGGLEISGDDYNRLIIHLPTSVTNLIEKKQTHYADIRFKDSDGNFRTLLSQEYNVILNITEEE